MTTFSTRSKVILVGLILVLAVGLPIAWQSQIIAQCGPEWRGITVGCSSTAHLFEALGNPERTVDLLLGAEHHYWDGPILLSPHRIVVRSNLVAEIDINPLQYEERVFLSEVVQDFGTPSTVEWSMTSPGHRSIPYPEMGVLVEAVALPIEKAIVTRIVYFVPRTQFRFFLEFRDRVRKNDPFPGADVIGSKDPWFGTSEDARR